MAVTEMRAMLADCVAIYRFANWQFDANVQQLGLSRHWSVWYMVMHRISTARTHVANRRSTGRAQTGTAGEIAGGRRCCAARDRSPVEESSYEGL